ncbi:hypothetical protein Tco_1449166 [Tanacetum coccineum]
MIANPDNTTEQILEPLSKMTEGNKKQYIADVKVMNYLLQAIPNDIYNSVDACKNAKYMWEQIKQLMFGSDVTNHVRHLRLMDKFDKFAAKEGESLESVYERLTTLVNIMDRNNVHTLSSPYYVTYPSSVADYEDEYQGKLQGDSQEDKLINAMMLLARAITQKFSTPTNNRLRTSSNTRNQAVIQDGRVDIQTKNAGYGGNDKTLEELTAAIIMMARIQPDDDNADSEPSYDAKAVSELAKKTFKERENRYLDDIVDLEEKLSSHDRIVYKIAGLGYKNPERLKKVITVQPKMYHGEMLHSTNLKIDSPDSEETLEDAKEIRLKMRNKMVQLDYGKLNALYETFVPQQEPSVE